MREVIEETACTRPSCPKSPAPFCSLCGLSQQNQTSRRSSYIPPLYQILEDVEDEALYAAFTMEDSRDKRLRRAYVLPNLRIEGIARPMRERDEEVIPVSAEMIAAEIAAFDTTFAGPIALLREKLGSHLSPTLWGVLKYYY